MKNYQESPEDLDDILNFDQSENEASAIYEKAVKNSSEQSFYDSIEKETQQQGGNYYQNNEDTQFWVKGASYFFNLLSALSCSYIVFWLGNLITGSFWVSLPFGIATLLLIEKFKRKASNHVFKDWFFKKRKINTGWLSFNLVIGIISIFGSSLGFYFGVLDLSFFPESIKTTENIVWLEEQKKEYQDKNDYLIGQKNNDDVTYYRLQPDIKKNDAYIMKINDRLTKLKEEKESDNDTTRAEHESKIETTALFMAAFGTLSELAFELCIFWLWRFKFICFLEKRMAKKKQRELDAQKLRFVKKDTPPNIEENNDPKRMYTHVHEEKRTIKHIKPDGKSAYYTATQVKNRIADYKGRVKEAKEAYQKALKEGDNGKIISSFESVNTNTEKLGYWQGRVLELNNVAA